MKYSINCFLWVILMSLTLSTIDHNEGDEYAFNILADIDEARLILNDHCFDLKKQIGNLEHYYLASAKNPTYCPEHSEGGRKLIKRDSRVLWHEKQIGKTRCKRNVVIPQSAKSLWYMNRGGIGEYDLQVDPVWKRNINGKNVVVAIIDDGVEKEHTDISPNFDPAASYDFVDDDTNPDPYPLITYNNHGTRCAGVVAGVGKHCAVGIAFGVNIGGIRVLSDTVKDSVEASGIAFANDYIDIYSSSWGPLDDGKTVEGPGHITLRAFHGAVEKGRQGKGSIFVWASGNGGDEGDSCSCDGYVNQIFTLAVGSVTIDGNMPRYLEMCSATLISTFSGNMYEGISTIDLNNLCTSSFSGTSASAPMAAGIVALGLQVRPDLTWRDVQHIALRSTLTDFIVDGEWIVNGVGRKYSHKYGYGQLSAAKFVQLSLKWSKIGEMQECRENFKANLDFNDSVTIKLSTDSCRGTNKHVVYLENVQFVATMSTKKRGCLKMVGHSPAKTESILLFPRKHDVGTSFEEWAFLSVAFWGEKSAGDWSVTVSNLCGVSSHVESISLVMYGTVEKPPFLEKDEDDIDCPAFIHSVGGKSKCVSQCPLGYCEWFTQCVPCVHNETECPEGVSPCIEMFELSRRDLHLYILLFVFVFVSSSIFICKYIGFSFK